MKLGHMALGVCIHVSQCGTELGGGKDGVWPWARGLLLPMFTEEL